MHCCHGTQAMDNNRICHCLLTFHERGKQYFVQSFLRSMKLLRLSLNFTLKLWAEFLALMNVDYAWTYLKRTQLQCVICTVCEQPACLCLSWSAVAMRALTWVVFVPRASFTPTLRSGSSPTPTAYSQCNMTLLQDKSSDMCLRRVSMIW